jgi:hypothetical protein
MKRHSTIAGLPMYPQRWQFSFGETEYSAVPVAAVHATRHTELTPYQNLDADRSHIRDLQESIQ